ncbi:MAG: Mur ligase family protein [Bacillota bacterium]|nr:Mur ligase family protein [Bacillota bacterium]MDW7684710.1 Mur ligase family protein [Bacillota bacterium]
MFYNSPSPLIGITGTNGKTSTILMLKYILEYCGLNPAALDAYRGNLSFDRFMQSNSSQNNDYRLIEVPAEALRQKQMNGEVFQVAALTNLSTDHLASCHRPETYYAVKSVFFSTLPKEARVVVNADDQRALTLVRDDRHDFITYALHYPNAMIVAENITRSRFTSTFDISVKTEIIDRAKQAVMPETVRVRLGMPGEQNIYNALLAASIALLLQVGLKKIAEALGKFPGIRRNMELIAADRFYVVDDGACNRAAIRTALDAAETITDGNILLLHGIYGGGGQEVNRCVAAELAAWSLKTPHSRLFVTRSMYHCKHKYQVRLREEKAFLAELKEKGADFAYYPDLPDAVDAVMQHAQRGDLVLLLGGHTMDKASDMVLRAGGELRAAQALMSSGIPGREPDPHVQPVSGNAT